MLAILLGSFGFSSGLISRSAVMVPTTRAISLSMQTESDSVPELRKPDPLTEAEKEELSGEAGLTESQRRRLQPKAPLWRERKAARDPDEEEERGWGDRSPKKPS